MQLTLLGAGQQGTACALDWLRQPDVSRVRVLDSDPETLDRLARTFQDGRIETELCDVTDADRLRAQLAGSRAVVSAVPYFLNLAVTKAAIAARTPLVDMGGNTDVVFQQRALDEDARAAGVGIIPDQGLAPGLAGVLAAHAIRQMDEVDTVRMRVGGLPQDPQGPLGYALVFSMHGLINEYVGEAVCLENGKRVRRPTLTAMEKIRFPSPVGNCEAVYTSGGTSTLPWTFEGKVRQLDYKTVRYPGHWQRFAFLKQMGMLESDPVTVGRVKVAPREVLAEVLAPRLTVPDVRDLVVLRVKVVGRREGKPAIHRYEMLDYFDAKSGLTAMMRTTAFPVAETALMLARGQIAQHGVLLAETVVPGEAYVRALRSRGLRLRETRSSEHEGREE